MVVLPRRALAGSAAGRGSRLTLAALVLQRSVIADYPEDLAAFAALVDVPEGAVELDYLIGDPAIRVAGLAPESSRQPSRTRGGPILPPPP